MKHNGTLIAVVGPTAVGKTALSVRLAQYLGTEIISADSRQLYREMNIGTAKPDPQELAAVPHHFINSHSIVEEYSAGQFEKDALPLTQQLLQRHGTALLTGGSGLYVSALTQGMDQMPEVPPALRQELNRELEQQGLDRLLAELSSADPLYYQQVDRANPQRIVRALEVCRATGLPYSSFRRQQQAERPFHIVKIGLQRERQELYERIDLRMDQMLAQGLREEVIDLLPYRQHNALQTVGYKEIIDYLDNCYDWNEAVRLLKRNSRHYAKRQLTWFGKDPQIRWFHPDEWEQIIAWVHQQLE